MAVPPSSRTLAEEYLDLQGGSSEAYRHNLTNGQRLGQAFFNALSEYDKGRVLTTPHDPFYSTDQEKVMKTLEWLIDTHPAMQPKKEAKR